MSPSLGGLGLPAIFYLLSIFGSCRKDPAPLRDIRFHTSNFRGVAHAQPAQRPRRYCVRCHGNDLYGGVNGEPSCWTCHGVQWLDDVTRDNSAPPTHTVDKLGFMHHPSLLTPLGSCEECHGVGLVGQTDQGLTRPGCELCHARLWESGAAASFK